MNLEPSKFANKEKIIFETLLVLIYLHHHHFIYRDLKPNNIIVDRSNTIILIDLDRMIKINEPKNTNKAEETKNINETEKIKNMIETEDIDNENEEQTIIIHQYSSPELKEGHHISYSTDIYSLGMLVYYIIFKEELSITKIEKRIPQNESYYINILNFINKCVKKNPKERPTITEIVKEFYLEFYSKTTDKLIETRMINNIENISEDKYIEYLLYIAEYEHPYSILAKYLKKVEYITKVLLKLFITIQKPRLIHNSNLAKFIIMAQMTFVRK